MRRHFIRINDAGFMNLVIQGWKLFSCCSGLSKSLTVVLWICIQFLQVYDYQMFIVYHIRDRKNQHANFIGSFCIFIVLYIQNQHFIKILYFQVCLKVVLVWSWITFKIKKITNNHFLLFRNARLLVYLCFWNMKSFYWSMSKAVLFGEIR